MKSIFRIWFLSTAAAINPVGPQTPGEAIKLVQPSLTGKVSIEEALALRRSLRTFKPEPVSLGELSQLLWAAHGITEPAKGYRTAPSGMAKYPLRIYAVSFNVIGLEPGIYRYEPVPHQLRCISKGTFRDHLGRKPAVEKIIKAAGLAHADPILTAPMAIIITGDKSIARMPQNFYLEAGHAAQNVLLQCVPMGLGGVPTVSFKADAVTSLLALSEHEIPVYVVPVGKKM